MYFHRSISSNNTITTIRQRHLFSLRKSLALRQRVVQSERGAQECTRVHLKNRKMAFTAPSHVMLTLA